MKKFWNWKISLLGILLLAAFLRLWQLGVVPSGVTHDEMGYIYNAYSIAKTGRTVFGEFLPFLTWVNTGGFPFLPVPIYLSAPFFWLFDISATVGRLPSAFLGVLDVILVYFLIKQLFNKHSLALLSAFFLAISPWHLHFSRSAYDPNFSLFFFLLGIATFIWEIKKNRHPILSPVSFLLAIFSYRGMSVILVPLVAVLIWYGIKVLKMSRRQIIAFCIGIGIVVVSLAFVIAVNGRAYLVAEGSIFNDSKMQEDIDTQIREAQGPLLIRRIFLNKPMYMINTLRENYLRGYSPEFLFLYTEPSGIYSIWSRGRIYFLDVIFIILGLAYLYKINRKAASFLVALVLIGGLPGMIGGMPYSARNFFLSSLLPILSASGVFFLFRFLPRSLIPTTAIGLVVVYTYVFGSYLFDYYGRYALYGSEAWVKSLKDMSSLIIKEQSNYNKIIVGQAAFGDFLQYAFYSKVHPIQVQRAWQNRVAEPNSSLSLDNVSFISKCLEDKKKGLPSFDSVGSVLYFVREDCARLATPSAVLRDYHGNTVWKVYQLQYE